MKISELISKLKEYDQNREVFIYDDCEDPSPVEDIGICHYAQIK